MIVPLFVSLFLSAFVSSSVLPRAGGTGGINDFSCKSSTQPVPVVLLHGLGATYYEDLNGLQAFLATKGFCTFAITYGAYDGFPFVGGFKAIDESSKQLADYIAEVVSKTGSSKVDLVGHSEGGFQTLYVPKFTSARNSIRKAFSIAPPSHGTTFGNLFTLARAFGVSEEVNGVLSTFGCKACNDLQIGGDAVTKLNQGPITQPGIQYTVLTSKYDEMVTPAPEASFIQEDGVRNLLVQDFCPLDPVGHLSEAYDLNVWNLVLNELQDQQSRKFACTFGSPGK
ncbi:alpha/beta-hydrolase [Violaceomyces palustris]|uniref:Alpha/beta-hydrolase n=1 Tax=Violaceomyces palustris TaxID=1673888 RepID=A0ACD0NM61_9BASI|nr:alpha/beta-hydrolase [Violaceomyces palustris]